MWTKIVNLLGFWTSNQISNQYNSPNADWWENNKTFDQWLANKERNNVD